MRQRISSNFLSIDGKVAWKLFNLGHNIIIYNRKRNKGSNLKKDISLMSFSVFNDSVIIYFRQMTSEEKERLSFGQLKTVGYTILAIFFLLTGLINGAIYQEGTVTVDTWGNSLWLDSFIGIMIGSFFIAYLVQHLESSEKYWEERRAALDLY